LTGWRRNGIFYRSGTEIPQGVPGSNYPYFPRVKGKSSMSEGRNPHMRAYECVYIIDPTLEEQAIKEKEAKLREIVTSRKGAVHKVDNWGKRRLAYPINKFYEGTYTVVKFTGSNDILAELNRVFRFDDGILRHMIVVDSDPIPLKPSEKAQQRAE
jgi:small subunit ribosomal protein S6